MSLPEALHPPLPLPLRLVGIEGVVSDQKWLWSQVLGIAFWCLHHTGPRRLRGREQLSARRLLELHPERTDLRLLGVCVVTVRVSARNTLSGRTA